MCSTLRSCDKQVFVFMLKPLRSFMNHITRVKFHILSTTFPTATPVQHRGEDSRVSTIFQKSSAPSQTSLTRSIYLLAIPEKSLDRALFLYIHFYTRSSIELRCSFYHYRAHSKLLQIVAKYHSIEILFQNG